jgi:hypothetical protein
MFSWQASSADVVSDESIAIISISTRMSASSSANTPKDRKLEAEPAIGSHAVIIAFRPEPCLLYLSFKCSVPLTVLQTNCFGIPSEIHLKFALTF